MYASFVSLLPIIFLNLNFIQIKTMKIIQCNTILDYLCEVLRFAPTSGEEFCEENSPINMIQSALHDMIVSVNISPSLSLCNVHFVKFQININKYVDTKQQS